MLDADMCFQSVNSNIDARYQLVLVSLSTADVIEMFETQALDMSLNNAG